LTKIEIHFWKNWTFQ